MPSSTYCTLSLGSRRRALTRVGTAHFGPQELGSEAALSRRSRFAASFATPVRSGRSTVRRSRNTRRRGSGRRPPGAAETGGARPRPGLSVGLEIAFRHVASYSAVFFVLGRHKTVNRASPRPSPAGEIVSSRRVPPGKFLDDRRMAPDRFHNPLHFLRHQTAGGQRHGPLDHQRTFRGDLAGLRRKLGVRAKRREMDVVRQAVAQLPQRRRPDDAAVQEFFRPPRRGPARSFFSRCKSLVGHAGADQPVRRPDGRVAAAVSIPFAVQQEGHHDQQQSGARPWLTPREELPQGRLLPVFPGQVDNRLVFLQSPYGQPRAMSPAASAGPSNQRTFGPQVLRKPRDVHQPFEVAAAMDDHRIRDRVHATGPGDGVQGTHGGQDRRRFVAVRRERVRQTIGCGRWPGRRAFANR